MACVVVGARVLKPAAAGVPVEAGVLMQSVTGIAAETGVQMQAAAGLAIEAALGAPVRAKFDVPVGERTGAPRQDAGRT